MAEIIPLDVARRRRTRLDPWESFGWIAPSHETRTAAALYAKAGLHPIAIHGVTDDGACTCHKGADCAAAGKHPCDRGWQTADLDAAALDVRLRDDWRLNVGLRMGPQPGGFSLVALDIDGDLSLLDPLVAELGPLPETLTARTGRGGWHFIFRVREGVTIRNRVRLAPGVDVRSTGGQIVVAPSMHRSGNRYCWTRCQRPEVLP